MLASKSGIGIEASTCLPLAQEVGIPLALLGPCSPLPRFWELGRNLVPWLENYELEPSSFLFIYFPVTNKYNNKL